MKLFLLIQSLHRSYDTYDSCVVCAKDEESARMIHPFDDSIDWVNDKYSIESWAYPSDVTANEIGEAIE